MHQHIVTFHRLAVLYVCTACFYCMMLTGCAPSADDRQATETPVAKKSSTSADLQTKSNNATPAYTLLVMDPLAAPLSCNCVTGHGQRDYHRLAQFLSEKLDKQVNVLFNESLALAQQKDPQPIDFIIGEKSVVEFDAQQTKTSWARLGKLTDNSGISTVRGWVMVRKNDQAASLADLKNRKLMLGPIETAEAHGAVLELLLDQKLNEAITTHSAGSIDAAVFAVTDGEADACVVPSYLPPLLAGCGKIEPGSLRKIEQTAAVPFIELFASTNLSLAERNSFANALLQVGSNSQLLTALESQSGFELIVREQQPGLQQGTGWTDWRGAQRDGLSPFVPRTLPPQLKELWQAKVTGPALAAITATTDYVIVPDKDRKLSQDRFLCFHADSGELAWELEYESRKKMEYTNAPRAAGVIADDMVFLQGALGELHCVELKTGRVIWKRHLVKDFGGELLNWGCSTPPLVLGEKLIINPGAQTASLAALNYKTGKLLWKTPGHAAAYAAFIPGTFQNQLQIIGYDSAGLGGWSPASGQRLWEVIPPEIADFNVGTPVIVNNQLLVATENNGTRLYSFNSSGKLNPKPVADNQDLAPDTCSLVVLNDRVFGAAYGELFCLDLKKGLTTIWSQQEEMFYEHVNLIAGNDRLLIWTTSADLMLTDATSSSYRQLFHWRPFKGKRVESMSHPAIVGRKLYLRSDQFLKCFLLPEPKS